MKGLNHILIHYEFTCNLWHLVLNLFGVLWAMSSNILELLHCWKIQGEDILKRPFGKLFMLS
jgi:hypothetical protein